MFIENTPFWRQQEAKKELSKRILNKIYSLDWRNGCDNKDNKNHNKSNYTCFQINMDDDFLSEDSYCLDCLYKQVFKELFPEHINEIKDNTEG